jgi:hypothetical protein
MNTREPSRHFARLHRRGPGRRRPVPAPRRSPRSRSATSRRCTGHCRSTSPPRRAGGPRSASSRCSPPSRPACRRSPPRRPRAGTSAARAACRRCWATCASASRPSASATTSPRAMRCWRARTWPTTSPSNPASIKGQTIVLTANSTGDYAVQSCLKRWGLAKSDVTIKNMGQAEIISAMSSNNADLGGLWAPEHLHLEEKAGARCCARARKAAPSCPAR